MPRPRILALALVLACGSLSLVQAKQKTVVHKTSVKHAKVKKMKVKKPKHKNTHRPSH